MMQRLTLVLALLLTWATPLSAQRQTISPGDVWIGQPGFGCHISTGSGSPAAADPDCSFYYQTDSGGAWWQHQGGIWVKLVTCVSTDKQVLFNDAGGCSGSSALTFDKGTGTLTVTTLSGALAWSHVTSTPTTFAGYGIVDTFANLLTAATATRSGTTAEIGTVTGSPATNDCAKFDASGNLTTAGAPCGSGAGSVTSVALTVPGFLSVSGSPITTSGTLAVSLATQSANTIFAGPTTGAAAAPTFRAMVSADLGTTLTPQFARVGFGAAADATAVAVFSGEYFSPLHDDGTCTTSATIDYSVGNDHTIVLTHGDTCAFTFSNPVNGGRYCLLLVQDGTGGGLASWTNVLWPGGTAPTLTTTPSKTDLCTFLYVSSSGKYLGACSQNY